MSGLIWVQTVCKFLSTDDTSRQRVNKIALTQVGKELINHIILVTVIVMWESVKKHAFLFCDQA